MTEYDRIGGGYSRTRRADPRIAARIETALGDSRSVVNAGAGAGSYEPSGRYVVAVEPSRVMIGQRPAHAAPPVQAVAEHLPFADQSFDAAMAALSVHHWSDPGAGLRELRRVARRRIAVLTGGLEPWDSFWLHHYFPAFVTLDRRREVPPAAFAAAWGRAEVAQVPVPHDCRDGFAGAFWRRPEAYLDPAVRSGMSLFPLLSDADLADGLQRLSSDLRSGAWDNRFGAVRELAEIDLGYRLITWAD